MNSVKIAYIICVTISELFFLACAILTPLYITTGWYIWSVVCVFIMFVQGIGFHERLNSWDWK